MIQFELIRINRNYCVVKLIQVGFGLIKIDLIRIAAIDSVWKIGPNWFSLNFFQFHGLTWFKKIFWIQSETCTKLKIFWKWKMSLIKSDILFLEHVTFILRSTWMFYHLKQKSNMRGNKPTYLLAGAEKYSQRTGVKWVEAVEHEPRSTTVLAMLLRYNRNPRDS